MENIDKINKQSSVLIMKGKWIFFLTLCYLVFLSGCTTNTDKSTSLVSTDKKKLETNTTQDIDKNIITDNCLLDDEGNLLILDEDEYELYTYEKFPGIPGKLGQIIQMLSEGDNIVRLNYHEKLSLYFVLEESKSEIVGGNDVDIFNLCIDQEQDIVSFSIENLIFHDLIDDDYSPQLLDTFNLLFGVNGKNIYSYFMEFYRNPIDGISDETWINGLRVTYRCTPKHQLVVNLVPDNGQDKQIQKEEFVITGFSPKNESN